MGRALDRKSPRSRIPPSRFFSQSLASVTRRALLQVKEKETRRMRRRGLLHRQIRRRQRRQRARRTRDSGLKLPRPSFTAAAGDAFHGTGAPAQLASNSEIIRGDARLTVSGTRTADVTSSGCGVLY